MFECGLIVIVRPMHDPQVVVVNSNVGVGLHCFADQLYRLFGPAIFKLNQAE